MAVTCVFCDIVAEKEPAVFAASWVDAVAIYPLNPVTFMHMLVIPRLHVADFAEEPVVTGVAMQRAAELTQTLGIESANLITSKGAPATQSVFHLHVHVIPRKSEDGLALPWYSGKGGKSRG